MFDRFTDRARNVVVLAQAAAAERGHEAIGPQHLLAALHREGTGVAAAVLREAGEPEPDLGPLLVVDDAAALATIGIDLIEVRERIGEQLGPDAAQRLVPFDDGAKAVLVQAVAESEQLGHPFIGTEHVLLALDEDGRHRARILELAPPGAAG